MPWGLTGRGRTPGEPTARPVTADSRAALPHRRQGNTSVIGGRRLDISTPRACFRSTILRGISQGDDDFFTNHQFTLMTTLKRQQVQRFHSSPREQAGKFKLHRHQRQRHLGDLHDRWKVQECSRATPPADTVTDSYLFTYLTSGSNSGKCPTRCCGGRSTAGRGPWSGKPITYYDTCD